MPNQAVRSEDITEGSGWQELHLFHGRLIRHVFLVRDAKH
jgi:hypothetical protein